jgi:hypothetical protein
VIVVYFVTVAPGAVSIRPEHWLPILDEFLIAPSKDVFSDILERKRCGRHFDGSFRNIDEEYREVVCAITDVRRSLFAHLHTHQDQRHNEVSDASPLHFAAFVVFVGNEES